MKGVVAIAKRTVDEQTGSTLIESADPEIIAAAEAEGEGGDANEGAEGEAEGEEGDAADEEEQGEGEADGDEPEDDFNAAWEVLDVARTIYEQTVKDKLAKGESSEATRETQLKLADCYSLLGDVSCETGESICG